MGRVIIGMDPHKRSATIEIEIFGRGRVVLLVAEPAAGFPAAGALWTVDLGQRVAQPVGEGIQFSARRCAWEILAAASAAAEPQT